MVDMEWRESRVNASQFSLLSAATSNQPIEEADEIKEVKTLFYKGKKAFRSVDFSTALSYFNAALEIEENNAELLSARCVTYLNISEVQKAAEDAQRLVNLHPNNGQCLFLQGLVLKCQGQIEKSFNIFVKSLSIAIKLNQRFVEEIEETVCQYMKISIPKSDPNKSKTNLQERTYQVGVLLFNYQKYNLCVGLLDGLMRFLENQAYIKPKIFFLIAMASSGLGKGDLALQLYEECLKLASEMNNLMILTKTLINLAKIHSKNGDIYQNIFCLEKLIEIEKNLTENEGFKDNKIFILWSADFKRYLRLNLRNKYKFVGNLKRAYSYTQEYVRLVQASKCPERIKSERFLLLGDICESMGKYSSALEHYEEYLRKVESCGYGHLVSKAHGYLGRIHSKLKNWDRSFYYHSLLKKSTSGNGPKGIMIAERLLADTFFLKRDFVSAIHFYRKVSTVQMSPYQLCQVWLRLYESYAQTVNSDGGLKYLENSLNHSRLHGYEEITILCEYHYANMYCSSNKEETLQLAELYFKRAIHFLQRKIENHLQTGNQCPKNIWSDLTECYKGMQVILAKQQRTDECVQYAESLQQILSLYHRVGLEGSFLFSCIDQREETLGIQDGCSSLEEITKVVNRQKATVCFYSLLKHYLLIWIFQPGKGIVETFVQMKSNPSIQEQIKKHLVNSLQIHDRSCPVLFYEGRSLPSRIEENVKNATPNLESSQSNTPGNERTKIENSEEEKNSKLSSLTYLSTLLLSPLEHILCKLPDRSHLVFIASDVLQYCPFGALQNKHGICLGEQFSVSFVQSMAQLSQISKNIKSTFSPSKNYTQHQFYEAEKSTIEFSANLASKSSQHSPHPPDCRNVSNPKALKLMKVQQVNPLKTNQGVFRSSTSLINLSGGHRNNIPEIRSTATINKIPHQKTQEHKGNILIMTNPQIPRKSELYGQEWNPSLKNLQEAESEGRDLAASLQIFAINGKEATKEKFLKILPTSSVVHIATWANCHEGILAWSPSSTPTHPDRNVMADELSYLVTCQEISSLSLQTKLVVLSCGQDSVWRGLDDIPAANYLANAFLQAGAHCVLVCLKPVPDVVKKTFFKHFYSALNKGNWVSEALWKAQNFVAAKDRFKDISFWCPFVLFGKDTYINLHQLCQAMMHQLINSTEEIVKNSSGKNVLTPMDNISEVLTMEQNLNGLQEILGKFLHKYSFRVDLLEILLQLMINWPGGLKPVELPSEITGNDVCVSLLKFLGFNFVSKNIEPLGGGGEVGGGGGEVGGGGGGAAYVLYPFQVPQGLFQEACLALSVLKDFSTSYDLIRAWYSLLPLKQETISSLIDLMYMTKSVWGLQLHLTDLIVKSVWCNPDTQRLLTSMGYQQIGRLLNFHASPRNRKLLMASFQFALSISCFTNRERMNRFDTKQFGVSLKSELQNNQKEAQVTSLKSLGIFRLPRKQLGLQTPWMRAVEQGEEMKEKMELIRKQEQMKEFYREFTERGNNMYRAIFATQAQRVLDTYLKKSPRKLGKVKVHPGGTASRERIPCIWSPFPTLQQVELTRQQADPVLKQWQKKMNAHYKNDLLQIYLPYATS